MWPGKAAAFDKVGGTALATWSAGGTHRGQTARYPPNKVYVGKRALADERKIEILDRVQQNAAAKAPMEVALVLAVVVEMPYQVDLL